ncbi:MAG: type VI secretion system baseplate subunit TssG [Spirochaetaceae bacterium]|jgi:type VI secretion system ImpH/TssG family protein|nr:type VI secretion system baseplate subunit TssG [Spirochaetaceae bacterium]
MENIRRLVKTLSSSLAQKNSSPDFWGLIRKLENSNREKPRFGYAKNPADENVRFGQIPYLYLPASDIAQIIEGKNAGVDATIFTYFLGLLGINGPMPLEFTSYVYQRSFNHFDHTWRRFLDIVHHRMHVLYYRAFAQNEQSISADRPDDDSIRDIIKSLNGLPPSIDFGAQNEKIALGCASVFSFTVKNRSEFENALRRLLRTNIKVNDFIVAVYDIQPDDYAQLSNPKTALLGVNLQIGRKYLSATHQFEIEIGPIDSVAYRKLVIKSDNFDIPTHTERATRLYLDRPLNYSIRIHLERGVVTTACLRYKQGAYPWNMQDLDDADFIPSYLGYNCWIGNTDKELEMRIKVSQLNRKISNDACTREEGIM